MLFKAKAKTIKTTTMESVHNRMSNRTSIKKHCSYETHVAVTIQDLIREQNGLLF